MDAVFIEFARAHDYADGNLLATTISPQPPTSDPARLYNFHRASNAHSVTTDLRYKVQYNPSLQHLDKKEASAWVDVFTAYYNFVGKLLAAEEAQNINHSNDADWNAVYEGWKDVSSTLQKGYSNAGFAAWTIPCLYEAAKYLRIFAIKADDKIASHRDNGMAFGDVGSDDAFDDSSKNEKLEDAARMINRIFALCLGDRSSLEVSRKWALYYMANILFKTYFKLNTLNLCKNVLRPLQAANTDMPPLTAFPKSHQVTFKFYNGVLRFLEEDYSAAEEFLDSAYRMCYAGAGAKCNLEGILMYLIPTRLVTAHSLPSLELLQPYPNLARLFMPLRSAILRADLSAFNTALEEGNEEFVKRRIYLTLERGRDVILRNIFRKVYLAGGFEPSKEGDAGPLLRRTRVSVKEFAAALQMAGAEVGDGEGRVDEDEVECLIANAIYKNLMKGYIARDRGIVVLKKGDAFPGTKV